MNYDLILLVVFYLFLLVIFKVYRKKFEVQWHIFALYKTQLGINFMDKLAKKYPRTLSFLGYWSIFLGFLGMVVTFVFIIYATYQFLFVPSAEAALAPLLPGISVSDKLPVLSFWHWIIAILFVATIHEFAHGVYARLKNIKIKSSGFAFFGPLLAAFVEPDEQQLKKKSLKTQLLVFSAGPFSNILLSIVAFLVLAFVFAPLTHTMIEVDGIVLAEINTSFPIKDSGLQSGFILEEIDSVKINDTFVLGKILLMKHPGDVLEVKANGSRYNVTLGSHDTNKTRAVIGIAFSNYHTTLKKNLSNFSWLHSTLLWINMLLFWIFNISLGVGLFNLLPLGPVDGGRMFYAVVLKVVKDEQKAMKILTFFSVLILTMILINMWPFIFKLLKFIVSPFM